jgi:two-component system, cell cycle response regulator
VDQKKELKGYKILVADDEKEIRDLIDELLTSSGYHVIQADNGRDALELADKERPDLILLDVNMPEMEGTDVKARMNLNSALANIPVIFVTGNTDTEDKVGGFHLGIDDYITKPFSLKELLARVDATLSRRRYYEEISMTDGLTGLMNIHYFKKQFSLFFDLVKRHKEPVFSLAVIDIDDLKKINDTYGHGTGDFVLKDLATALKGSLRKTDIITRYGGDEFTVIFPRNTKMEAAQALERVCSEVDSGTCVPSAAGEGISFDISIGIAEFSDAFENPSEMFDKADSEMYKAKKSKRRM